MFHFCPEELFMIMAAIPFVGRYWTWLRSKIKWSNKSCPNHKKNSSEQKQDSATIADAVSSLPSAPKKGDTVSLSDAITTLAAPSDKDTTPSIRNL